MNEHMPDEDINFTAGIGNWVHLAKSVYDLSRPLRMLLHAVQCSGTLSVRK